MRHDDLQAPLRSCAVDRWPQDGQTTDVLAAEVPVALEFNGISHAVMLATPQDLEAFALGCLFPNHLAHALRNGFVRCLKQAVVVNPKERRAFRRYKPPLSKHLSG